MTLFYTHTRFYQNLFKTFKLSCLQTERMTCMHANITKNIASFVEILAMSLRVQLLLDSSYCSSSNSARNINITCHLSSLTERPFVQISH